MADDAHYVESEFERRVERFESSWRSDEIPAISDYLTHDQHRQLSEAESRQLLTELVMIDTEYRWLMCV